MTKKQRTYGKILLGIILYLGVVFAMLPKEKERVNTTVFPENFQINLADTLVAGTPVCFGYKSWMKGCDVIIQNSWGVSIQKIDDKFTKVILKDSLVFLSGLNTIHLNCNGQAIAKQQFVILPQNPREPLETYLGSKSITADGGKHWAMITAIPVDKFKNAVKDNTPITFDLYRPNGENQLVATQSAHLVAYHKIYSGSKTGKTLVGSGIGNSIGQEKTLLEEAGYPENFSIKALGKYNFADNHQFFKIETSQITDKYGNHVADGTLITFLVQDMDNKKRQLTAYTIDGVASLNILNPIIEGNLKIKANIYGDVYSNELSIFFKKLITELPIEYNKEQKKIIIGPLIGPLGQYVSDGSEVKIAISPIQKEVNAVVKDGYAKLDITDLKSGIYDLSISFGGLNKHIKFKR